MERELGEQINPVILTKRITVFTSADAETILAELSGLAEKWHEVGSALRLSAVYLKKLQEEDKPAAEKLRTVVTEWLAGNCACPTWEVVMKAVKDSKVGDEELAKKLDEKYKIMETVEESGKPVEGPAQPIGCGIVGCVCDEYISSLTDEIGYTFPNLELSEGYSKEKEEDIKKKSITEFHECLVDYDLFSSLTWRSIERKKASQVELIEWITKNELFQTYGKIIYPRIPLFCHFDQGFKAAKNIADVHQVLREHVDTFNHSMTVDILLNLGGSKHDKRMLDNFRDKYYGFMRRNATEMSRVYSHPSKSDYFIVRFTLKRDITKISLAEVDYFCTRLTFNLCISRFSMKLIALVREEEGLVTYIYQMPSYARNFVFPLTDEQIHSMRQETITAIRCCSYNLIIPEEAPEGVESLYGITRSYHADDPKPPEEEVAMEVEAGTSEPKIPLYQLCPEDSPFRMDSSKVPAKLERLQDRCPGTDNYVAILSKPSDKILYSAMVLCQHAHERKLKNQFVKCVVVANSKPRAQEMFEELKEALPNIKVYLFTGTEENSMTVKLCLSQNIVLVCTSGKFYSELESDVVKFSSISMIVVDDCQYGMRHTLMEAVFHKYITNRVYDSNSKASIPQILGVTCNPGEASTALEEDGMRRHLFKVAGGVDSRLGLMFTEDILSDTYTPPNSDKPQPKPKMTVNMVKMRDPKRDMMVRIHVAILFLERSIGLGTPHNKWTAKYGTFIKSELESALAQLDSEGQDAPASLKERVGVLELIQCFAESMKSCVEFGSDSVLPILQAPLLDSALNTTRSLLTSAQIECLQAVTRDVEAFLAQRSPVVETISDVVCKQFTANRDVRSRGILFVDSFKDAQYLCGEITKSHFFARPAVVPRYLLAQYSLVACSEVEREEQTSEEALEKGREGLKAFARGDCCLLIIPYALEQDEVKIENIESEFCFLARLHRHRYRDDAVEAEYVLNFMLSPVNKPFAELQSDFDMCRTELGLRNLPTGQALKKQLKRGMEDVMHAYQARFIFPLGRVKKNSKEPNMEKIQLRCKKCKVLACHGMEIYCFFVDGGRHCVVPHRDFSTMYQTQPYLAKHKFIKRVNRLERMFCCNCGAPWGVVCHFPAKGCQLPVLRFKHFVFEMNHKYYYIKMLDDALFKLPPITASAVFRIHGPADMEMD